MFRKLEANEIEVRYGTFKPNGYCKLLIYTDARIVMGILDEQVGQLGWTRQHEEIKGNVYCGLSIRNDAKTSPNGNNDSTWITKWDVGTESNAEGEKGEASDSFKRAAVNWGIGRELYTAGEMKFYNTGKYDKYSKFTVKAVTYNDDGTINNIGIVDDKDNIVYATSSPNQTQSYSPAPSARNSTPDYENRDDNTQVVYDDQSGTETQNDYLCRCCNEKLTPREDSYNEGESWAKCSKGNKTQIGNDGQIRYCKVPGNGGEYFN